MACRDVPAVAVLFDKRQCFWRDPLALPCNIATLDGRDAIAAMLEARPADVLPFEIA